MPDYYRIMLGKQSAHADQCFKQGFVGADFGIAIDLSGRLPMEWREFNRQFIPVYLKRFPGKSRIGAGLACGALWTVAKGLKVGDVVVCPDGEGNYRVGEVAGDYYYSPGDVLPHRRPVRWRQGRIARADMSFDLKGSTRSALTVSMISRHQDEINRLLAGRSLLTDREVSAPDVEDPIAFAMEKHLEEFLVHNWSSTELGRHFDIWAEDGELVGQQYATDTGPIDILAVSKDRKRVLVVELKRGRASDSVVGQILRYMSFVREVLAEEGQSVEGAVIALEDDPKLRRSLSAVQNVRVYRYRVQFSLIPS